MQFAYNKTDIVNWPQGENLCTLSISEKTISNAFGREACRTGAAHWQHCGVTKTYHDNWSGHRSQA